MLFRSNLIGYISRIAFLSINRDEDRPYTILWFISQISSVSLIETPMTIWFASKNKFHLFWIPVFASGLGDGLAEIVGKKWGKHKYEVYALFSNTKYISKPQDVYRKINTALWWLGGSVAFVFFEQEALYCNNKE